VATRALAVVVLVVASALQSSITSLPPTSASGPWTSPIAIRSCAWPSRTSGRPPPECRARWIARVSRR